MGSGGLRLIGADGSGDALLPGAPADARAPSWSVGTITTIPTSLVRPAVSGEPRVGGTVAATAGKWTETDFTVSYAWSRCDAAGAACSPIAGAADGVYDVAAADLGSTLRVTVTATNSAGSATATSFASAVAVAAKPYTVSMPTIGGGTSAGQTLSLLSPGSWTHSPAFAYRWRRCDAQGTACSDIAGQNGASYVVTGADGGHTIRLAVTGSNGGGTSTASTAPVAYGAASPGAPSAGSDVAGAKSAPSVSRRRRARVARLSTP